MDQLTIREKVGVNYMLLELSGTMNSNTCVELQQKVFQYIIDSSSLWRGQRGQAYVCHADFCAGRGTGGGRLLHQVRPLV